MVRASAVIFALVALPATLIAQTAHSPARTNGSAEAGTALFQHSCIMCHAVTSDVKIVGPSLYSVMRGPHALPSKSVRTVILNGKGAMPAFDKKLTDEDIADLLAYLRTL